jgi:HlyD family secretion protein
MAQNGARQEEKDAASAQVRRAAGAIDEVSSYIDETILLATEDGYVTEIFPEVGELVGTGAPIMNVATDDVWFTFNIREDRLEGIKLGSHAEVYMPSGGRSFPVKITRIKNVGDFAAWKATKALDGFDLKVFEVRATPDTKIEGVAAGMSVILKQ